MRVFVQAVLTASLIALSAAAAFAQAPTVAAASPAEKGIWQSGPTSIWEVACSGRPDAGAASVTVEARQNGRAARAPGCYPSSNFISVIWTRAPGQGGPDVIVLGQSGGSAACGDIIASSFGTTPALRTLSSCPAEDVSILIVGGVPTFDAFLGLGFNMATGADVRAGPIAIKAYRDGFEPDLQIMTGPPMAPDDLSRTKSVMVQDLRRWAMSFRVGPAGISTPDTTEVLLNLVLSGRADQARSILFEAGQAALGPGFDVQAFWDDFCLAVVDHPSWKQFRLDRLLNGGLVVESARRGQRGRAGQDYLAAPNLGF